MDQGFKLGGESKATGCGRHTAGTVPLYSELGPLEDARMERRIFSILGNSQKLDGGAMFGNAPKILWEKWAPPDESNRIDLACRAMLVREPARTILFEAGIGAFFEPRLRDRYGVVEPEHVLLTSLRSAGVEPEDVDVVVLSHLHFDHAGGVLTKYEADRPLELAFPRARFVVGKLAWTRATNPHARDRASFIPELHSLLEKSGRLEIMDGASEVLGPDFRFHVSNGHTPGMMLAEVPGSGGPVVFCGDLIPGVPWVRRAITMGYDRYPELLIDEKTALLDDLAGRGGRLFYTHDPQFSLSSLTKDERGQVSTKESVGSLDGVIA
jgi:glyoxylase-like metal-dependent hydrolase (beta-lactamase superfamily II)